MSKNLLSILAAAAIFLSNFLAADNCWHDFYLVTIPKSGSHLMHKLMRMLLEAHPMDPSIPHYDHYTFPADISEIPESTFAQAILKIKNFKTYYPSSHTNFTKCYLQFSKTHPNYTPIVLIRDLRDVLVSCVYFQWAEIEREIGPTSFDQKLSFLIHLGHSPTQNKILNIYRYAEEALQWMDDPNTVLIRFEELVGSEGGGTGDLQKKAISIVAGALEVPLDSKQLRDICYELFGADRGPPMLTTFRQGKIGSWKDCFSNENLHDFNQKWGQFQLSFGYDDPYN